MRIECFVKKDYVTTAPFSGINVIKNELLNQKAVVVKDKEEYVGTLTATDILQRPHNLVIDCISKKQKITTNYTVCQAMTVMKEKSTDVLPVYKNSDFYGLIYKNDLLDYLTNHTNELTEKTKELQKINTTKDSFFSIIAHDLRSPFNTLLGFSSLLQENARDYTQEEIQQMSKNINIVSQQTYELLDNLLQWSMIQKNQIAFNPQKLNLHEIVENILLDLESSAKSKEIRLLNSIPNPIYIYADINMLKTILRNLINNSIKFTNTKGKVYIESQVNENFTKVSIIDSGVGMNKSKIEDLFKIQKQNSTYGTNNEKGSGFGLILCKEFIEQHGGIISVDSQVGKGSSFIFTISKKQ